MISIVSYGAGNVSSVANMFRAAGFATDIVDTPAGVLAARKLVLPGVGAFDFGMRQLDNSGLSDALTEAALNRRTPTLGICLGMQLMCQRSEEGGERGLGWFDAEVVRFAATAEEPDLKIPHMGWNSLSFTRDDAVVRPDDARQRFYFVHSYYVDCKAEADVIARAWHGREFVAAFGHDNIFGVQFHPEKSHRYGLALIARFGALGGS